MRSALSAVPLLLLVIVVEGCAMAGTSVIRGGRAAYNDAIVATNNEQLLAMIVRMRYQEPTGLLAVASITANVRIQANVGAQFGVGPESNYSGNLVPLSAGALYEENPTISYTPVEGQQYLREMLAPLPLDLTVPLLSALGDSPAAMTFLVMEINGVRNPMFSDPDHPEAGDRFAQIADLIASLHRGGQLIWTQETGDEPSFVLLLRGEGADYAQQITRLHELLGLDRPRAREGFITLPVVLGVGAREGAVVELRTRSAFDLFRVAASSVDVPADHLESGLASPLPPVGPAGAQIRIRRSANRPGDALVAVPHHGWWYWIDATDGQSKETFRLLEAITTARVADTVDGRSRTPVLTVPVSR
jgi:hypothetical protein